MPKKPPNTISFELAPPVRRVLSEIASSAGFDLSDYLTMNLNAQAAEAVTKKVTELLAQARQPPLVLPPDVERSNNATGYAGVFKHGPSYTAFWDRNEKLGLFPSLESAVFARYWYNKGRLHHAAMSAPPELARNMGALVREAPVVDFKIGDVVNYEPTITSGKPRQGVKIVAGPVDLGDNQVGWRLEGMRDPAHELDLVRVAGDDPTTP